MASLVPDGQGDCFAAAFVVAEHLIAMTPDIRIVHGLPVLRGGEHAGHRFWHAWTEMLTPQGWVVLDYSNGLELTMPRFVYYALGHIEEHHVWRYTMREHLDMMVQHEQYGPWVDGWEEMGL